MPRNNVWKIKVSEKERLARRRLRLVPLVKQLPLTVLAVADLCWLWIVLNDPPHVSDFDKDRAYAKAEKKVHECIMPRRFARA